MNTNRWIGNGCLVRLLDAVHNNLGTLIALWSLRHQVMMMVMVLGRIFIAVGPANHTDSLSV